MTCLHYWASPFQVATHHLARQFVAAGWDVLYVSAPLTPLHPLKTRPSGLAKRFRLYMNQWSRIPQDGLLPIVPGALLAPDNRPLLRSGWVTRNWPRLTLPSLAGVLRRAGFTRPDVLYLDNFYHAGLRDLVTPRLTCYHMADDYSGFAGYGEAFRQVERSLCQSAELVVYPSITLRSVVDEFGANDSLYLPNGVECAPFAVPDIGKPPLYQSLSGPIAVYVGAMDAWFDQALMEACARQLPHVHFVLLGPAESLPTSLLGMANVHALGPVARDRLPGYLRHADVGLIPFDTQRFARLLAPVRPLKLLEYLAAGLPVVSRKWQELDLMAAPVTLAETGAEFIEGIRRTIEAPPAEAELKAFAARYEWSHLFAGFEGELRSRLAGR